MWRTGVVDDHVLAVGCGARRIDLRDDERHPQRRLVGEHAVRELAVFAEAFAVIRSDDHERWPRLSGETIEERAKGEVGPGHFAEVGIGRKPGRPFGRRLIGRVRVVDVHPREPLALLAADPVQRRFDDGIGTTLPVARFGARGRVQSIVVDVEADVQPEAMVERESRRRRRP